MVFQIRWGNRKRLQPYKRFDVLYSYFNMSAGDYYYYYILLNFANVGLSPACCHIK